jgi:FkbM family methyltransferase
MSLRYGMSRQDIEIVGQAGATNKDLAKIINDIYLYTNKEEMSVGRWLSIEGYWESWITSWFTNNIKPGFTCLDIGANYGYYTRIMEKLSGPNGKVYSIEANSNLTDLINKSINDYPLKNGSQVTVYSFAVSDSNGKSILKIPNKYIGGSSIVFYTHELPSTIPPEEWDDDMEVETRILDEVISGHIDIIKMDIEGAEPLAWKGMQKILDNTDVVVVELGSYSPSYFLDEIYYKYNVSKIDVDGSEIEMSRSSLNKEQDLVMAVLRKHD